VEGVEGENSEIAAELRSTLSWRRNEEFSRIRQGGIKIKRWWFMAKAKELMRGMYPDATDF
jgi:hypothetical protein